MQVVSRLEKTFLFFSALLVVIFCAIIIGIICTSNLATAKEQTYSFMVQIAERPRTLEGEQPTETPFPYFAVSHTQTENIVVGNTPLAEDVKAHLFEWVDTALTSPYDSGEVSGENYLWLKRPFGLGKVIVFADFSSIVLSTWHLFIVSCVVAALVCIGFFFLARWLAKKATSPVEAAFQAQRRFISDASHELKTPLTVILTNAELAEESHSQTECKRYTHNILQTARRMKTLSQDLLDLSRAESVPGASETTNLSTISEELALSYEALCFEAGHELAYTIQADIQVKISAAHAERIISILLDNAAKYAEGKGPINFSLEQAKQTAVLCVSNPSPELDSQALTNMFSRFWKADTSRTKTDSYGLGLAIAKTIVENAGGTIEAAWQNNVLRVIIKLPVA